MPSLFANLIVSTCMVALTVSIHLGGLVLLIRLVSGGGAHLRAHENKLRAALVVLAAVFGVFAIHTVEIWAYALVYMALGETPDLERALYFSTTTFASLGLGDVVLSPRWRMLSAIEGANGVILFAWSTAFLMTLTGQLRLLEHDWFKHRA